MCSNSSRECTRYRCRVPSALDATGTPSDVRTWCAAPSRGSSAPRDDAAAPAGDNHCSNIDLAVHHAM